MLAAFTLALGQLHDPRVLRVLFKSLAVTLVLFALLGTAGWYGLDWLLSSWFGQWPALRDYSDLASLLLVLIGGWLLWRIVALLVLQLFADEVVLAVEVRYYPAAAASARKLGLSEELGNGLKSAGRALLFNLLALPVALVLLITGVGAPLVFVAVNAVLLGRELQDMVWLRHRPDPAALAPLRKWERLLLGGAVTALLTIPFVNLLAPLLGAAAATHLIHRKDTTAHAA
jgi:CysZ protein